jgi:predicted metal-dependent enzyme (double-stranded beta helix superfamily)
MFELEQFVADCRLALTERSGLALQEVVARAVSDPAALVSVLGEPSGCMNEVLFHDPDLTVLNLAWAPHQWTLPHNHNARAVIGMYAGGEDNLFWRRLPEGHRIEAAGAKSLRAGDVTILGRDIIHSVTNPLGKLSCALHVYDGNFFAADRSQWDAESLEEQPYDRTQVSPMFLQAAKARA